MAKKDKLGLLQELYGEEGIELQDTGHAKVNGELIYMTDPSRELSLRHELIADLAATGMKPSDIARNMKHNPEKSDGGHYSRLLKDPRIRAKAQSGANDLVSVAKAKIAGSVEKAADNVVQAVQGGDLKTSQYVLATQGITDKQATVNNAVIDFGSWLSSSTNTKTMHEIPSAEVISDTSALPEATDGETLY